MKKLYNVALIKKVTPDELAEQEVHET